MPLPATFSALRHRNFRLMWISLLVSNSGTWLQGVTQDWLVYSITGRALDLGVINGARAAVLIVLPFFGGTLVDRADKRKVLIVTQTLFALSAAVLGVLAQLHLVKVWHILAISVFSSVVLAVDQPARQALLPQLVPRSEFMNAIALNSITFTGAAAIGPALAGPAVRAFGLPGSFYLNAASFFAVIWAVWMLRLEARPPGKPHEPPAKAVKAGLSYIAASPPILLAVSLLVVFSLLVAPYQLLLPVAARRMFSGGLGVLSSLRTAPGLGSLAGGLIAARLAHRQGKGRLALYAGSGVCAAILAFCATRSLGIALALLFLAGAASTLFTATVQTLMQHLTSDEMRGRVMSLFAVSVIGMQPLGALPLSALADRIGIAMATAAATGLAAAYLATIAIGFSGVVRRLDETA